MSSQHESFDSDMKKLLKPSSTEWIDLEVNITESDSSEEKKRKISELNNNNDILKNILLSSLQMHNILVLAGSGTSIGDTGGPSMTDLWNTIEPHASKVFSKVSYKQDDIAKKNIEHLLSHCESYLQVKTDPGKKILTFIETARTHIIDECSSFLDDSTLDGHKLFLHRLSRRRTRDSSAVTG